MQSSHASAQGEVVPPEWLGELHECDLGQSNTNALQASLANHGYAYVRGYLPRDEVLAARRQVFEKLAAVGEIDGDPAAGNYSGSSRRRELVPDLGEFWRGVAETWALRRLTHGDRLNALMSGALGVPACAHDFIFLRPANPGKSTGVHCDYGFFTRCTETVLTAWIALGDVPLELGPLFLLENSHTFEDVIADQRGFDVARDTHRTAAFKASPLTLAKERGARLMSTHFTAGDVLIFPMFTLHGSLDNRTGRSIRLSVDLRFQPASAPRDPRYFGPDPTGTTGAGYGELTGAKPLSESWHVR